MSPAFEVAWDRALDAERARGAAPAAAHGLPSVSWRQCLLPTDVVAGYHEALQRLTFKPFSLTGHGTDGFVRGVEVALGFGATSVAWWGAAPEGLEPLARWYDETWEALQGHLTTARPAGGGA